ncbi:hypothetical protein [Nocardia sp. BMG51109]|uniref:hypothetical protein n=1 Tax=Nocardia sp. BMG51109 TaxID=1056816 RepID=UPI0004634664|nr:hypothetical protein [Nocardia sp. BMG51109]
MPTGIRSATRTLAHFAAGALLVNTVPHTVKGLTGQRFPTPFADPPGVGLSSPTENITWGAINLAAAGLLLRGGVRSKGQRLTVLTGGTLMAFGLSRYFGALDPEAGAAEHEHATENAS